MSPEARRIVIPIVAGLIALLVILAYLSPRMTPEERAAEDAETPTVEHDAPVEPEEVHVEPADDPPDTDLPELPGEDDLPPMEPEGVEDLPTVSLQGLRAVAPDEGITDPDVKPQPLGSLDPRQAAVRIEFSRDGAGMDRLTSSTQWLTAAAKRQADAHYRALDRGDSDPPPLPDDDLRYLLKESQPAGDWMIPVLSTQRMLINGQHVWVFDVSRDETGNPILDDDGERIQAWAELGSGRFRTLIVNENDETLLRITRHFHVGPHGDITLQQRLENLTGEPLDVKWMQYGPSDLIVDRSRYLDRRRFRFGYLLSPERDPSRTHVRADDNSLVLERRTVFNRFDARTHYHLWPNDTSREEGYELSWFGAQNRYFALAVHPVLDADGGGDKSLTNIVEEILYRPTVEHSLEHAIIFTYLHSPEHTISPGETLALDLGVYAGPMDRQILGEQESFISLSMDQLILYQMSTWCAICTFQWLAHILLAILTFLHDYMVFDWGIAIIMLVIFVRLLLHPITKKSQVNMMRFGKKMQKLKPEIERLQKKYKGGDKESAKKMQQEQIKLFREHGVNPFQMLGCLPMFLQVPIWIALYAMLYFAIEIRHEPAFFGMFQLLWDWPFLADLSSGDHFLGEFDTPKLFFGFWNMTGINVLPILMGVVLFFHQKYMTPPSAGTMTPEQEQQQKIMRVMMVTMLPIVLYNAPSGLTMYILTSSCIGIIESRYVRRHVDQLDLEPEKADTPPAWQKKKKKKKPKDPQARAYSEAVERQREKSKRKKDKPKTFKKRK